MCLKEKDWTRVFPTVLLGLRAAMRADVDASPAELMFGMPLRLPGEFFLFGEFNPNLQVFLEDYREYMNKIKPIPVAHKHLCKPFIFKSLNHCTHVFLKNCTRKALEHPYVGPFKILKRISDRVYEIEINGAGRTVTVELLKPAYTINDQADVPTSEGSQADPSNANAPTIKTYKEKESDVCY